MRFARWAMNGLVGLAALILVAALVPMPGQAQSSVLNSISQAGADRDNAYSFLGTVTRYAVALYGWQTGTATLDGLNPTVVTPTAFTTGLRRCFVQQRGNAAPGDDPVYLTVMSTVGTVYFEVFAWKNTGGTDPTLVASTNSSATFDWSCEGY